MGCPWQYERNTLTVDIVGLAVSATDVPQKRSCIASGVQSLEIKLIPKRQQRVTFARRMVTTQFLCPSFPHQV